MAILAGCAIHPLPEDVTRSTTIDIAQKIRCEGRQALDNLSVRFLRQSAYQPILDAADRIEAGQLNVTDFMLGPKYRAVVAHLEPQLMDLFLAYTMTAATFDFDFLILEENNNQAAANFGMPLGYGMFSLGNVNAGAKFDRQNDRKFQLTNSFYDLHNIPRDKCTDIAAKIGNVIYPITGKIGLEEVFETFITLDSKDSLVTNTTTRFSDTLTFTTVLTAGAAPKISLTPGPLNRLKLADATLTLSETRNDQHKVTITLAKGARFTSQDLAKLDGKQVDKARTDAKKASRLVADQRRMEDFFIIPRDKVIINSGQ
jgi:hypothetical protein